MIVTKNKKKVTKAIKEGNVVVLANMFRLLGDTILETVQKHYNITRMLKNDFIEKRTKNIEIPKEIFLVSGISLAFKNLTAVSDMPMAITSPVLADKLNINIIKDKNDKERPLLLENNIRNFISNYSANNLIKSFNRHTANIIDKMDEKPNTHILDCTVVTVNLNNSNYENSTVTTDKGGIKKRGYKIAILRGILPTSGILEEIRIDTIRTHDLTLSKDILFKSKHLKAGDLLLMDRGFLDIITYRNLTARKINVIMPCKKDMIIYKTSIEEAIIKGNWKEHPNKKRKGQSVQLVTGMEEFWLPENEKNKKPSKMDLNYKINCAVVRFELSKNKELISGKNSENIHKKDSEYAYAVFMCNDSSLTAEGIIRRYEQRPEIEEDNRQLKDFWGLEDFHSTKYNFIVFYIVSLLIAYNYYQIFKNLEEGREYANVSLPVAIEKEKLNTKFSLRDTHMFAATEEHYGIYGQFEFMDIYAECNKEVRGKLKQLSLFD